MIKKRKSKYVNPNSANFFFHLEKAILLGDDKQLSLALINYKIGTTCKDCSKYYVDCTCEGDNEILNLPCRYCSQNYCICSLNLNNNDKIRVYGWFLSRKKLNNNQLFAIVESINNKISHNEDFYIDESESIFLKKFYKITHPWFPKLTFGILDFDFIEEKIFKPIDRIKI